MTKEIPLKASSPRFINFFFSYQTLNKRNPLWHAICFPHDQAAALLKRNAKWEVENVQE